MKRREFLKSMTALAAGTALPGARSGLPKAQRARRHCCRFRKRPKQYRIHGVAPTSRATRFWNCYDRLISHEMKTVNARRINDRDKFKMEPRRT